MISNGGVLLITGAILVLIAALSVWPFFRHRDETRQALQIFRLRRERLEARFFELAAARGIPRGLRWVRCEWKPDVSFARDLQTGLLTAFAGVQIYFEAIEGGDMEEVEAVSHFREASAVFHYQKGVWGTGGKALFNMTPAEAVIRLDGQYAAVSLPHF